MMKEFDFIVLMKKSNWSLQQETDTDGCNKSYSIKNTEVKVTREGYWQESRLGARAWSRGW